VVCFKPAIDNRENEQVIVSKDGTQIDAFVVEGSQGLKTQVEALKKEIGEGLVIGIDEA